MIVSFMLVFLQGCPDPTTAADLGNPGPGGAAPGAADGPAPGADGAGFGPPPAPEQFSVEEGGVAISGTLQYTGDKKGQVRLDFLRTEGDAPPHLLHVEKLADLGAFEMRVPANTGPVTVVAFVDVEDDGPNSTDPAGMVQLAIEEAAITDVAITLSDAPDLGALTPGNEPPPEVNGSGSAPEQPEVIPPKAPETAIDNTTLDKNVAAEQPPPEDEAATKEVTEVTGTE